MRKLGKVDFDKLDGLVPAIIQDDATNQVLMLGFMNEEALTETRKRGRVVFWSRTKGRLWEKGEESGNTLTVVSIAPDCDDDTLLFRVKPAGPTCHTGAVSCFDEPPA
jgi:phosphoribosyl-ATP pyrophosphohydrolase/phosphoribosyl-AMP cyclohydrolase